MHCKICGKHSCELLNEAHSLVAYGLEEDDQGNFHYHDRNYVIQEWKCSNGHEFQSAGFNHCWCGWNSQNPDIIYHKNKPFDVVVTNTVITPEMCECGRLYKDRRDQSGKMMCSACYTQCDVETLKILWSTPTISLMDKDKDE